MPWHSDPCPTCPRVSAGLPLPCRAQTSLHRRYCEFADPSHSDYSPNIVAFLKDEEPPAEVPPAPPSLFSRAWSFAGAVIEDALAGFPRADDATYEARLAICRGDGTRPPCEHYDPAGGACNRCGCPLADWSRVVTSKARMQTARCPIGKW